MSVVGSEAAQSRGRRQTGDCCYRVGRPVYPQKLGDEPSVQRPNELGRGVLEPKFRQCYARSSQGHSIATIPALATSYIRMVEDGEVIGSQHGARTPFVTATSSASPKKPRSIGGNSASSRHGRDAACNEVISYAVRIDIDPAVRQRICRGASSGVRFCWYFPR